MRHFELLLVYQVRGNNSFDAEATNRHRGLNIVTIVE